MVRLLKTEEEARRRKEKRETMDRTIEEAKWNMYAEKWELAEKQLENARNTAVSLRAKAKIDDILALLEKCRSHEKVEL